MRRIISIPLSEIPPGREAVLQLQGIEPGHLTSQRIDDLFDEAVDLFYRLAQPAGILKTVSISQFAAIFKGDGRNEPDAPLGHIFPQADSLSLMALTMGQELSQKVTDLFARSDFALGAMLDAVASVGADRGSVFAESLYRESLQSPPNRTPSTDTAAVLLYSPGYCGWHISSQLRLFDWLHPEEIGIRLNKSFLMTPLKSISGVLVAGAPRIHWFRNNYSFCKTCWNRSCQKRINQLKITETEA